MVLLDALYELDELNELFRFFAVDDLTPPVGAGLGVDAVRLLCLAGVLIDVELRRFQRVVGTARPRPGM